MPQPLPSKEGSLFRQVIKCYESKQYKKGLKTCDVSSSSSRVCSAQLTPSRSKSSKKCPSTARPWP